MKIVDVMDRVLFEDDSKTMKETVENAVRKGINIKRMFLCYKDLSGINLEGVDLSGLDLNDINLSNANLSGANLEGSELTDINLSNANLSGANLRYSKIIDCNFQNANLMNATLCNMTLDYDTLTKIDLNKVQNKKDIYVDSVNIENIKGY